MLKMAAILKSNMAATGTDEKNGNNLIWVPGSLLHHLRPKTQIVHEPPTNNISNQTKQPEPKSTVHTNSWTLPVHTTAAQYKPLSPSRSTNNFSLI